MAQVKRLKSKVCLVGEAAVGKTSLIRRYVLDEFSDSYLTTMGAKVSKKELAFSLGAGETIHVDMTIWDIMGEKSFRDLVRDAFFTGSRGILAVCDLTRMSTLQELDDWVQSVFAVVGEVPVVYAVNKVDLREEAMVLFGEREIRQAIRAFDAPYFYTSAKSGENVESVFRTLGESILMRAGLAQPVAAASDVK